MNKIKDIRKFMFSGKAFFRIKNTKSKQEFIYKVYSVPENKRYNPDIELWYVSLLADIYDYDNWRAYNNIGSIHQDIDRVFKYSTKSKIESDHIAIKLFSWFLESLEQDGLPEWIEVLHIGKCGRCSRPLRNSEDIRTGFGRTCIEVLDKKG